MSPVFATVRNIENVLQSATIIDTQLSLLTTFIHKNGNTVTTTMACAMTKMDPQGAGSAVTYLRRYALCASLGIAGTDDDDGNASAGPVSAPKKFGAPPVVGRSGLPAPTPENGL